MYDDVSRKYLKDLFGTSVIGDCKNCNKASKENRYANLPCGNNKCIMKTKLDLYEQTRKNKEDIATGRVTSGISSKISKMNMLGFNEEICPPWVIMRDDSGENAGWFNPKLGVYGNRLYKDIIVNGDMILCVTDYKITKNGKTCTVEVYSILCGDLNLTYGITNAVYKHNTNSGISNWRLSRPRYNLNGIIILTTKDEVSGMKFDLLISKYGNRVAIPHDSKTSIETLNNCDMVVNSPALKQRVKFNAALEVLNKSIGAVVIPL